MISQIRNGDYVPDGMGGFVRLSGEQQAVQTALFCLQCRRGAFALLPELGSSLHTLCRQSRSRWDALAAQYCVQALQGTGLSVTQVQVRQQDDCLLISLQLQYPGGQTETEVRVS